jgi:hypothetical protein
MQKRSCISSGLMLIFGLLAASVLFAALPEPQASAKLDLSPLSPGEYQMLEELLGEAKLSASDLNFEKDWDLSTKGKSKELLRALQEPYQGIDLLQRIRLACQEASNPEGLANFVDMLFSIGLDRQNAMAVYLESYAAYEGKWHKKVKKPGDIFRFYEDMLDGLSPTLADAFSGLNRDDLSILLAWMHAALMESDDHAANEAYFAKQGFPKADSLSSDQVKELLDNINESALQKAALQFLAASNVIAENAAKLKYNNKKAMVKNSYYGTMVIGGIGDDRYLQGSYKKPLILLIEPQGNDRYELDINTGWDNYTYLVIDYSGDDSYLNPQTGGLFYAMSGLGISLDLEGNDVYRGGDFSFASLLGLNLHGDGKGNDLYESGLFSQGAALLGCSILLDASGNDSYRATTLAQGLGSYRGCGALLDYAGADTYDLGGKYTHAPLMPNDFRSMGQGMGFGFRPDYAGGMGLLFDGKGNDHYLGGVYAQGVGYWYALGMLIDESGNDVYNAIYYPQGSGIHLACGYLYDGAGDDAYYSRNGPGQGAGHDWGQGILIDAAGNDAYSIPGGNGLGLSNSVGIFIDKAGNDRYERKESQNYGSGAYSRSTGSIGIFLDEAGTDSYPDSTMADGKTWKKGTYGVGRDITTEAEPEAKADITMLEAPLADAPIAEIFAAASEWEVGSAVDRVKKAREIMLNRADEAKEYVLDKKLDTDSGLEYRALEVLTKGSKAFLEALFNHTEDSDSLKAKNAMSLIAGVGDSTLIEPIKKHLASKRYVTACLSLLGSVKSSESIALLGEYAFHPSERYRYIVARSFKQIGSPDAIKALENMSGDTSFLVKALIRQTREGRK